MKYLLFNVVVVAALVYLFVGGGPTDPVEAWLPDNVSSVIADVRGRLPSSTDDEVFVAATATAPETQSPPTATVTSSPGPAAKPDSPIATLKPVATAADTEAQISQLTDSNLRVIDVPERLAPPAILPESVDARGLQRSAPAVEPMPRVDGPLMSPRERRRELQRLAESMELFAVGKTSQ